MNQFQPYDIYGIIGYPLKHSMSPLVHTTSFKDHNIPAILTPFPIPPEELETLFKSIRLLNIKGLSVTIPHKQAVISYLDEITKQAKLAGAVNTIYWKNNKLCGDNTDVIGFTKPIQHASLPKSWKKVLLLGAGGAARATIVGLHMLGYTDITITNMRPERANLLAQEFNLKTVDWEKRGEIDAQIIINSTPLGMKGEWESETPYDKLWFKGQGLAYDIIYTPHNTRFMKEAEQAGWQSISGKDMFIEQAHAQSSIWTGKVLSDNATQVVIKTLSA